MKFILVQIWQNTQKANLQYTYLDIDLGEPFLVSFHNPFQTLYFPVYFECTENLTNKNLIYRPSQKQNQDIQQASYKHHIQWSSPNVLLLCPQHKGKLYSAGISILLSMCTYQRAKSKTAITFHNNVDQTPLVLLVFNISPCFKKSSNNTTLLHLTFSHILLCMLNSESKFMAISSQHSILSMIFFKKAFVGRQQLHSNITLRKPLWENNTYFI